MENFQKSDSLDSELASVASLLDSNGSLKLQNLKGLLAKGVIKKGKQMVEKIKKGPVKVVKVPGTDHVSIDVLKDAYRMARIRL